ncbi:MAG: DUF951 domain-containing protein [Ruminococcaceae bacterium]|nr:DUF951 domain-containing protein [Oscillospiraceae bacterium]
MKIVRFSVGDTLIMRKPHPCGDNRFRVARAGSDVRVICLKCSRDVTVERLKLEKNIKTVIPADAEASE